jgi:hypothetical protein
MTVLINAVSGTGLVQTSDGSGVVKLQSNGVATNALAWVNFNGSGGASIRSSYNVSSVTRSSTGVYYITFSNALADANYVFVGSASVTVGNFGLVPGDEIASRTTSRTGTFYVVNAASVNSSADANNINVAIFGN